MPYGSTHTKTMKETNSQPGGRAGSKTTIHMGPANGHTKVNKNMDHGLGRAPRGKAPGGK